MNDHESLVKMMKAVDVVISAVGFAQIKEQIKLISAIKEAGTIKVGFLPLNFPLKYSNEMQIKIISYKIEVSLPYFFSLFFF